MDTKKNPCSNCQLEIIDISLIFVYYSMIFFYDTLKEFFNVYNRHILYLYDNIGKQKP